MNAKVMEEKKPNFEVQDPLVKVNLRVEEELRMTNINGLLSEESRDELV